MGCENSKPVTRSDIRREREKRFTVDSLMKQKIKKNHQGTTVQEKTIKMNSIKSNKIKRSASQGKIVEHNYFIQNENKPVDLSDLDATIDQESVAEYDNQSHNTLKPLPSEKQVVRDTKLKEQIESLDVLIESIYDAVSKAQRNIRLNNLNELDFYFPYDSEEGIRKPKTVEIKLPSQTGEQKVMGVPLFSLINHTPLNIEEFNVKFKINMSTAKRIQDRYGNHKHFRERKYKICTDIRGANKKNIAEVELRCKAEETPEGISRIADALHKTL